MVQDSEEFGSAQQLGNWKNFPIHKQWLSRLCPLGPHHSNQQTQAWADGRAWTESQDTPFRCHCMGILAEPEDSWGTGNQSLPLSGILGSHPDLEQL